MKTIRLLPVVVLAGSALLGLKLVGLATGGGYTLTGIGTAMAQAAPAEPVEAETAPSEEDVQAAQAASEALFGPAGDIPLVEGIGAGAPTEAVLLERLAERRAELDALAAELDQRLAIVEAAEMRIADRMVELEALEARISGLVTAQDEAERQQFLSLVSMYETMRARDASAIFNALDIDVLVEVALAMDPRKLGPVVAGMDPLRAQELTVRLAAPRMQHAAAQTAAATAPVTNELPQIIGQ